MKTRNATDGFKSLISELRNFLLKVYWSSDLMSLEVKNACKLEKVHKYLIQLVGLHSFNYRGDLYNLLKGSSQEKLPFHDWVLPRNGVRAVTPFLYSSNSASSFSTCSRSSWKTQTCWLNQKDGKPIYKKPIQSRTNQDTHLVCYLFLRKWNWQISWDLNLAITLYENRTERK